MSKPAEDLAELFSRLEEGISPSRLNERPQRITKPMYLLTVDDPDERSIVLIIRTGGDGVVRAMIALPKWYGLPQFWEGPHEMETAVRLADAYAWEYGYRGVAVDIESSQLWNSAWGELLIGSEV